MHSHASITQQQIISAYSIHDSLCINISVCICCNDSYSCKMSLCGLIKSTFRTAEQQNTRVCSYMVSLPEFDHQEQVRMLDLEKDTHKCASNMQPGSNPKNTTHAMHWVMTSLIKTIQVTITHEYKQTPADHQITLTKNETVGSWHLTLICWFRLPLTIGNQLINTGNETMS